MNPELLKAIDPIVRKFGLYTSYELDGSEFVGGVEINSSNVFKDSKDLRPPFVMEHDFYRTLTTNGYEKPPTFLGISLEAAKIHPETGRVHDVSLRKVDPENERKQYHLHYWLEPTSEWYEAQIAVHREMRPDVCRIGSESISEAIERLRTHYSPEWGTDEYQQGKMDSALRELIE